MRPKKVSSLAPKVAKLTNFPPEVVEKVFESHFKAFREDLSSLDYGQISYEYFGKIRASKLGSYHYFKRYIQKARENPLYLSNALKARKLFSQALLINKERKFKQRWPHLYEPPKPPQT